MTAKWNRFDAGAQIFRGADGRRPGILLIPDAAGLRQSMFETGERLAAWGCHVVLVDLYHGTGEPPLDSAEVFAHGPDWERMNRMRLGLTHAAVDPRMTALLAAMADHPLIDTQALGCVGLSLGGRFALAAAADSPAPLALAVSLHGGALAIDAPDSPHLRAGTMRGHLYVAAAETDPQFLPDQKAHLETALTHAGCDFEIETFTGTKHGFATRESAAFDAPATERLWASVKAPI